jgi:hypothetical protein
MFLVFMAINLGGDVHIKVSDIEPKDLKEAKGLLKKIGEDLSPVDDVEAIDFVTDLYCGREGRCPSHIDRNTDGYEEGIRQCVIYRILSKQTGTEIDVPMGKGRIRFRHVECPFYMDAIHVHD